MDAIRPISHQSTNDEVFRLVAPRLARDSRLVDVGAGRGYFSKLVGDHVTTRLGGQPAHVVSACDLFPELFGYDEIRCDAICPDGRLPYEDDAFDVACSIEVVEHLEDQFAFARELHRIVRPGGIAVVSTPNVLSINSRVRMLHSGFGVLFDPVSMSSSDPVHTSGHIHPVSYYYLAYQLRRAGFSSVTVHYDRFRRAAVLPLVLLGAFVLLGNALFRARLARKKPELAAENREYLAAINSAGMLTSRSIVVVATN